MEVIAEIRRRHLDSKESISAIARDLKLSRPTVRKHLQTESEPVYQRHNPPTPRLGEFQATLEGWLQTERHLPKAQRRTARRLFEGLQVEGYRGAYDSVQRFVKQWKAGQSSPAIKEAFVPLLFAPGVPASLTGATSTQRSAVSCKPSRSRTSVWPIAARCSSSPIPEKPRKWCSMPITVPSPSSAAYRPA